MKRASHFKSANLLEILRFKEQPNLRLGWLLTLPWRAFEGLRRLRCGCEGAERGVGQHRCAVDVGFDKIVGDGDGFARQGKVNRRHVVCVDGFEGEPRGKWLGAVMLGEVVSS